MGLVISIGMAMGRLDAEEVDFGETSYLDNL